MEEGSSGTDRNRAFYGYYRSDINMNTDVDTAGIAVRPAIRVDLESGLFDQ